MKHKPAISIIIPVYNVEKYLRRCLDSVLNQTFTDWQAICVNDGSPDNSDKILAEYAARDSRFVIVTKENGGQSDARNVGLKKATGDYIMYLDSDDFIHPQTMEILHYMATAYGADMVLFEHLRKMHMKLAHLMARGVDISAMLPDLRNKAYKPEKISYFITDNILRHSTERNHNGVSMRTVRRHCYPVLGLYRRSLVADIPFLHGIIIEDFPWWAAVMLRRPVTVMIKTPLYFYMPNPTSSLNSVTARRLIESVSVGLRNAYDLYQVDATPAEVRRFNREFLWPFIITAMRAVRNLDNDADRVAVRKIIRNLYEHGVFDNPIGFRARRYSRRIKEFIGVQ